MPDAKGGPPLVRALGLLVGDLWCALTGRPRTPPDRRVLRHETEERTGDAPQGKVTLRRTTIEEIEVQPRKD
jgi:hypothetical protein